MNFAYKAEPPFAKYHAISVSDGFIFGLKCKTLIGLASDKVSFFYAPLMLLDDNFGQKKLHAN